MQTYVSRNSTPGKTFAGLYAAFAASQQNPKIVGINIVGPEHGLVALRDYQLHMQMFAFLKKQITSTLSLMPVSSILNRAARVFVVAYSQRGRSRWCRAHRSRRRCEFRTRTAPTTAKFEAKRMWQSRSIPSNAFILGVKADHPVTLYLQHGVPVVTAVAMT